MFNICNAFACFASNHKLKILERFFIMYTRVFLWVRSCQNIWMKVRQDSLGEENDNTIFHLLIFRNLSKHEMMLIDLRMLSGKLYNIWKNILSKLLRTQQNNVIIY